MKIHYFTPYALDKNIGAAYNECMETIGMNDYACFIDADCMWLTSNYGHQINDIISNHPEAGLFTCVTNRIGNKEQLYNGIVSENGDIKYHRRLAATLQRKYGTKTHKITVPISGMVMIVSKKVWQKVKHFRPDGLLGVDNDFSKKILKSGYPIILMKGVYVFHYYRLIEGIKYTRHIK